MIKYITPTGNVCKIFHFPGFRSQSKLDLMESKIATEFKVPENVQIITTVDEESIEKSPLIKQLNYNKTEYINSALGKDTSDWCNRKKIQLIYDALQSVTKEYCLILDGWDVVIVNNLMDIIEDFKSYGVKVLYNATVADFPDVKIETIPNQKEMGTFCYFNAGCCIGETETLKKIYKEALDLINQTDLTQEKHADSEQYWLRKVFANHTDDYTIGIDYLCKIFQVWHKVKLSLPKIKGPGNIYYNIKEKSN